MRTASFRDHRNHQSQRGLSILTRISLSSIILLNLVLLIGYNGCGKKKENQQTQLTAQGEEIARETNLGSSSRTTIAIFLFENRSTDPTLDWLSKGIAELLILDLSRCPQMDVISGRRLSTLLREIGKGNLPSIDKTVAAEVALRAGADVIVTGSFNKSMEMVHLSAQLRDVFSGDTINVADVTGTGLPSVFTLVDQLSGTIEKKLNICSAEEDKYPGMTDVTTDSINAYKAFITGLDEIDKLRPGQSIAHFEKAVEIDSSFAMAYAIMARYWYNIGNITQAKNAAIEATTLLDRLPEPERQAVEIDSNFAIARTVMAIYWHGIGDRSRALDATGSAMALLDRIPETDQLLVLAIDAQLKGNYNESLKYYERLIELGPGENNLFLDLGLAQLFFGTEQFEEASNLCQKMLQSNPDLALAHYMMGLIQLQQKELDSAQLELQEAVRLDPQIIGAHLLLAQLYSTQGQTDNAESHVQQALKLDPENPQIYNHLGYQYLYEKKYDQAIAFFKQSVALAPNDPNSHDSLGDGYFHKGDFQKAEEEYLQAVKLDPNFANSHFMLASIYEQQGEKEKAISHLNTFLKLSPEGLKTIIAKKKLEMLQEK